MARDGLHWATRITFPTSGPPSGKTSNEFHWLWTGTGSPLAADYLALGNLIIAFYNTSGTHPPCGFIGEQVSRTSSSAEIAWYDLDMADPHHYYGSPTNVQMWTLAPTLGTLPLPNECSGTLSYRSAYNTDPEHNLTTRPRASDRGRIYIGPLDTNAIAKSTLPDGTSVSLLHANFVQGLLDNFTTLRGAAAVDHWDMSVWSRKEQQFKSVAFKAMDNIPDTQRKRGQEQGLQNWITT